VRENDDAKHNLRFEDVFFFCLSYLTVWIFWGLSGHISELFQKHFYNNSPQSRRQARRSLHGNVTNIYTYICAFIYLFFVKKGVEN